MSWRRIPLKFPGTCIVCKKKIEIDEIALWSKGDGVKHEKCAEVKELNCIVCGKPAGCPICEFKDDCDLSKVSQLCICKKCGETNEPLLSYQESSIKKFHPLNLKAA